MISPPPPLAAPPPPAPLVKGVRQEAEEAEEDDDLNFFGAGELLMPQRALTVRTGRWVWGGWVCVCVCARVSVENHDSGGRKNVFLI